MVTTKRIRKVQQDTKPAVNKLFSLPTIFESVFNANPHDVFSQLHSEFNRAHVLDENSEESYEEYIRQEKNAELYQRARIIVNMRYLDRINNPVPQSDDEPPESDFERIQREDALRLIENLNSIPIFKFTIDYVEYIENGTFDANLYGFDVNQSAYDDIFINIERESHAFALTQDMTNPEVMTRFTFYLNQPVFVDNYFNHFYTGAGTIHPQGLDLNVNHHIRFPTFNFFSSKKTESVYHDASSTILSRAQKGFGSIFDKAKEWLTSLRANTDFSWIMQLTSDISVLSMLWCWITCWLCLKQFQHAQKIGNEQPHRPELEDFRSNRHIDACIKRLSFWSRNLVIVLTINVILRATKTEFFTRESRKFIDCILFVREFCDKEFSADELEIPMEDPNELLSDIEMPSPQSDFGDHAPYVVGLMVSLCSVMTGLKTRAPLSNTILTMAKTSKQQRDNLCEMLITAFEHVGALLKKVTKGDVISEYFYVDKISDPAVQKCADKIKDFLSSAYAGVDIIDPNRLNIYVELKKETELLIAKVDPKSFDYKVLTDGFKEIEKQSTILAAQAKALSGDRVEPVGVLFMGTPGTKKSVLTNRIANAITYATIPEIWKKDFVDAPHTFMFSKPIDKFWDTYSYNKWCLLADDIFQKRDIAGVETSDALDVIRIINCAAMSLQMADVKAKNNTFMRSPFFLANTNRDTQSLVSLDSVHDYTAVLRRFHYTINVTMNPKYNYLPLPTDKVLLDEFDKDNFIEGTTVPDDYWVLRRYAWDLSTKTYLDMGEISFEQVATSAINTHHEHVKRFYINRQAALRSFEKMRETHNLSTPKSIRTAQWYSPKDIGSTSYFQELNRVIQPQGDYSGVPGDISDESDSDDESVATEMPNTSEDSYDPNYSFDAKMTLEDVARKLKDKGLPFNYVCNLEEEDMLELTDPDVFDGFITEFLVNSKFNYPYTKRALMGTLTRDPSYDVTITDEKSSKGALIHSVMLNKSHPVQKSMFSTESVDPYKTALENFEFLMSPSYSANFIIDMDLPWMELCKDMERLDLFDQSNFCFQELFQSGDVKERYNLVSLLDRPQRLVRYMGTLFKKRESMNVDILTGVKKRSSLFSVDIDAKCIWNKIKKTIKNIVRFVRDNFFSILMIAGVGAGILYGLYKMLNGVIETIYPQSKDLTRMAPKAGAKSRPRVNNSKITLKLSKHSDILPHAYPQAGFTLEYASQTVPIMNYEPFGIRTNITDVQTKVVAKYFFVIYVNRPSDDGISVRRYGQCWNLSGQIFASPFHYIFMLDALRKKSDYAGATLTIMNAGKTSGYKITLEEWLTSFRTTEQGADCDMIGFKLEGAQPGSTGVLRYLCTEKDYNTIASSSRFNVDVVSTSIKSNDAVTTISLNTKSTTATSQDPILIEAPWVEDEDIGSPGYDYGVARSMSYNGGFSKGDCGALVFVKDGNFSNRCILGQHIAGTSTRGYASIWTREMAESILEQFQDGPLYIQEEEPDFLEPLDKPIPQGNFLSTHKFSKKYQTRIPDETEIIASEYQGKLPEPYHEIKHKPAFLRPFTDSEGNRVDPIQKSMDNYGFEFPCVENEILDEATRDYFELFNRKTEDYPHERRILTVEEALSTFNHLNKVSPSTSSGYPMNLKFVDDLKDGYFSAIKKKDISLELEYLTKIKTGIYELENMMSRGERPFFAYFDFPKDEIRKKEKVDSGGTRLISGSPFLLLVLFRMYFGCFMDAFAEANYEIGSAICVNPFSETWDIIGRKLSKFKHPSEEEPKVGAGDLKHLDGSEDPAIHNRIIKEINNWYGNHDSHGDRIRRCCFVEITNSKHIFKGQWMVEWLSSLPSGNPMTAIINTIYVNIAFRASWIILELPISDFGKCVYLLVLGDDNVFHVHILYRSRFNEITLCDAMAKIGLEYTTEIKTKATVPFRNLGEVEFLKRQWRFDYDLGRYVAPLRLESIANMLNWTKKKSEKSPQQITVDNTFNALRELTLHGREIYNDWSKILMNLKRKHYPGYSMPVTTGLDYKTLRDNVLNIDFYF